MDTILKNQFIDFLKDDLFLPNDSISFALRHHDGDYGLLPIILWKYGLATLNEVDRMFDWLESRTMMRSRTFGAAFSPPLY